MYQVRTVLQCKGGLYQYKNYMKFTHLWPWARYRVDTIKNKEISRDFKWYIYPLISTLIQTTFFGVARMVMLVRVRYLDCEPRGGVFESRSEKFQKILSGKSVPN